MDSNGNAEIIASRLASSISWRQMRQLRLLHLKFLQTAGVLVVSKNRRFSLERRWGEKGIRVEFQPEPLLSGQGPKHTHKRVRMTCEESDWAAVASIYRPGLEECLVAVLTGIPIAEDRLNLSL